MTPKGLAGRDATNAAHDSVIAVGAVLIQQGRDSLPCAFELVSAGVQLLKGLPDQNGSISAKHLAQGLVAVHNRSTARQRHAHGRGFESDAVVDGGLTGVKARVLH